MSGVSKRELSTQALAYLGDSVMEILVREYLVVEKGVSTSSGLNAEALGYVCAPAQACAMQRILPVLDDDENAVFHRGRNIGHTNRPRNATVSQYRNATGMEALFGWLYIDGRKDRIRELFRLAYGLDEAL